jgi:uncharacterized protein
MEMTSYKPGVPSWVDLATSDVAAAADFYSSLFGWEVPAGSPEFGGYRMALQGGRTVAGIGPQMQPGVPVAWATYVATSDADATAKAVSDAGGQTFMPPMDVMDAGRMAVFGDSTGAAFGVWQAGNHTGAGIVNEPVSLSWNELATREPDKASAFYRDVFGWQAQSHPSYTEWSLDGENSIAGMMPMDENFPAEVPPHWRVYFSVVDTDATVAKATELGGAVHQPPMDIPQGRIATLGDPQGAMFSVIQLAG